jgi:hypothetical protein
MTLTLTIRTEGFIASPVGPGWGQRATPLIEQTMFQANSTEMRHSEGFPFHNSYARDNPGSAIRGFAWKMAAVAKDDARPFFIVV